MIVPFRVIAGSSSSYNFLKLWFNPKLNLTIFPGTGFRLMKKGFLSSFHCVKSCLINFGCLDNRTSIEFDIIRFNDSIRLKYVLFLKRTELISTEKSIMRIYIRYSETTVKKMVKAGGGISLVLQKISRNGFKYFSSVPSFQP